LPIGIPTLINLLFLLCVGLEVSSFRPLSAEWSGWAFRDRPSQSFTVE